MVHPTPSCVMFISKNLECTLLLCQIRKCKGFAQGKHWILDRRRTPSPGFSTSKYDCDHKIQKKKTTQILGRCTDRPWTWRGGQGGCLCRQPVRRSFHRIHGCHQMKSQEHTEWCRCSKRGSPGCLCLRNRHSPAFQWRSSTGRHLLAPKKVKMKYRSDEGSFLIVPTLDHLNNPSDFPPKFPANR